MPTSPRVKKQIARLAAARAKQRAAVKAQREKQRAKALAQREQAATRREKERNTAALKREKAKERKVLQKKRADVRAAFAEDKRKQQMTPEAQAARKAANLMQRVNTKAEELREAVAKQRAAIEAGMKKHPPHAPTPPKPPHAPTPEEHQKKAGKLKAFLGAAKGALQRGKFGGLFRIGAGGKKEYVHHH
jgi:hypothetical protein